MELPMRLPVLPPQCYSPSPDHGYESRREVPPSSRQPLQESTGNIQHPHMAWYAQQLDALSSIPPAIPAPAVLRTQSFGPEYATPATGYTRSQQQERLDNQLHRRRRVQGTNPLMPLLTQAFQNYRKKQENKPDQTWPDVLETHFLDALLLIPHIGRKKYTVRQTKSGRNMLIGDYLWIAYCQSLPAGAKADPTMFRSRKKVSSHIQVLKNFFKRHRWFHFFFSARKDEDDGDGIETVSLKSHPVLIAVSEGRLPDERPNYEYFAHILALNDQVQFRPKRCWIFVSHEDVVVGADGVGHLPATWGRLSETEYPHLLRNLERNAWTKEEQQFFKGALLHEFTKELHQVESGSVREVSRKWESAFPELHQRLKAITSTTTDARCDMLHMHATLELKEKRRFPSGSNLSSWVEINIEQRRLLNHRWKVETRLVRPAELGYPQDDSAPEVIYEPPKKEFSIPYQHRPGCDAPRSDGRAGYCDCLARRTSREGVTVPFPVPFPADVWAQTLTNCAEYPAHPYSGSKKQDRERGGATKVKTEDGNEQDSRSRRRSKQLTQMDLVPKIAMMQEILSCPPSSPHEDGSSGSGSQRWTCRAVILWTFETTHRLDKEGKLVTAQARTDWRFLTILDPASDYHQRNAMVSSRRSSAADEYPESATSLVGASRPVSREAVMSPSSTYQQHLSANMSETFSSAWDGAGGLESLSGSTAQAAAYGGAHFMPYAIPSHSTASSQGYGLLDSFSSHGCLATPPPSASLASSFAQTFDMASTGADMLPSYMATAAGLDASSHALGGALSAVADPFLAHVGIPYAETHDGIHGWSSSHAGSVDSGSPWSTTYAGASAGIHHAHSTTTAGSWTGSQPQSASSRRGSDQLLHHHQGPQHQHQHQHQPRQARQQQQPPPWASCTTTPTDEHDSSGAWAVNKTAPLASLITHDHHQNHHQAQNRHHHPHNIRTHPHQNHSTAAPSNATVPGPEEEGSQDWVHLQTATSSEDLSHEWEEEEDVEGMPITATPPSPGQNQHQHHQQSARHSYHGGSGGRLLKRGREDEDEDGGFGDGGGGGSGGLDDGYGVDEAGRQGPGPAKRARADHDRHGTFDGIVHEEDWEEDGDGEGDVVGYGRERGRGC